VPVACNGSKWAVQRKSQRGAATSYLPVTGKIERRTEEPAVATKGTVLSYIVTKKVIKRVTYIIYIRASFNIHHYLLYPIMPIWCHVCSLSLFAVPHCWPLSLPRGPQICEAWQYLPPWLERLRKARIATEWTSSHFCEFNGVTNGVTMLFFSDLLPISRSQRAFKVKLPQYWKWDLNQAAPKQP